MTQGGFESFSPSSGDGAEQIIRNESKARPGMDGLDQIMAIPVRVDVVVGSLTMPVSKIMSLGRGAVIQLDRRIGDPVDIVVNGRVVARGEIVALDGEDGQMGVSLIAIVRNQPLTSD